MNSFNATILKTRDEPTKGTLIIIRGVPGSGKTTLAKTIDKTVHIEADMWFTRTGEYLWKAEETHHAHGWCLATTQVLLNQGKDVVVANTFTTLSEMNKYVEYTNTNGHGLAIFTMKEEYGSIHNVPEATMQKMRDRFVPHDVVIEAYQK